jgi:hypothetical protein
MSIEATQPPDQGARLRAAVQLGWRVAELYAQVDDPGVPLNDTLLPAHGSLEREDQLELQLRAAEGDARRAGIVSDPGALERLARNARGAASSDEAAEAFRAEVRRCHVELEKDLWALDEATGEAYELGNGMSDTYNRICRAYQGQERAQGAADEWRNVFHHDRVEGLKKLLGDLQARLNPAGVAVVGDHLDAWSRAVPERIEAGGAPPLGKVRDGLRRQTLIWRQLITGDKEPEAYLDREARGELRGELRRLVWSRSRRWLFLGAPILALVIAFLPEILSWYEDGAWGTAGASVAAGLAGAWGLAKGSLLATVRTRTHQWSELLWNRAVAKKVSEVTLKLDAVLPVPAYERQSLRQALRAPRAPTATTATRRRGTPPPPRPRASV